ncbi:MAG: hypothetical protein JWP91_4540 [Fibrobacteres bacterium]|nr:hypothetical protein [Fibrobacterota bacterium]
MAAILLGTSGWAAAQPANTLTAAEKKAGWILLFDGQDKNAHWRGGETGTQANPWSVEDSSMRTVNTYSFLCTKASDQFSNFEWQADWKLAKSANSGLFIRVVTSTYNDGYEYAILDDAYGGDRVEVSKNPADKLPSGKMAYIKRSGSIYDLYPTTKNGVLGGQYYDSTAAKPFGQWNHGVIWAEGNYIEHYLNDRKVVVAEIGTPEWVARFKNSKWNVPSLSVDQWARNPKGSLCLQAHGGGDEGLVWFRNLKVRPFTLGDTLVSPSVSPNGGNFSGSVKAGLEVAITGAVIHYTVDGSEPTEASPVYSDSIAISATTTLKARTFRPRFKGSSTTVAVFTKGGTSIGTKDLSPLPDADLSPINGGFLIRNTHADAFRAEVLDVKGMVVARFSMRENMPEHSVTGLEKGVYLVKLQRANQLQVRKIALQ